MNEPSPHKPSPLMLACYWGHARVVAVLLEAGANTDKVVQGKTALSIAQEKGFRDIVDTIRASVAQRPEL